MRYLLILLALIVGFYLYAQTFAITDPQKQSEIFNFLDTNNQLMASGDYEYYEMKVIPDGFQKYTVTITYFGIKDDTTSKFTKVFTLQTNGSGGDENYVLLGQKAGESTCAKGKIYFGKNAGQCR